METHFYKNIYIITLCNFWHRSYSLPNTQHIQKLATEDLWFLRYCRSRFFTFAFFMHKIKGISLGQNNKSCGILHHESNKIGFTFFWFPCDFLRYLQESAKLQHYWSFFLHRDPWEYWIRRNVAPAMEGGGAGPNSGAPVTDSAGKGRGKDCELTRDRFVAGAWAVTAPANPGGEALRRRPQGGRLRWCSGQGASAWGLGSSWWVGALALTTWGVLGGV
jgi:hypothetical protein